MWTGAGTLIWNIILAGGGWWLGSRITRIDSYLGPISTGIVVLAVVGYAWRYLTWKPYSAS
ncbi:MAG TPA: hypothetical protein VF463_14985 [Sphingobium sp.]